MKPMLQYKGIAIARPHPELSRIDLYCEAVDHQGYDRYIVINGTPAEKPVKPFAPKPRYEFVSITPRAWLYIRPGMTEIMDHDVEPYEC